MSRVHLRLAPWVLCLRGIGGILILLCSRVERDLAELLLKLGGDLALYLYVTLLTVADIVRSVGGSLVVVSVDTPNGRVLVFVRILQELAVRLVN